MADIQQIPSSLSELAGTLTDIAPRDPRPIVTLAAMQADETWTASNCTATADAALYNYGAQSLKVAVANGVAGTVSCTLPSAIGVRDGIGLEMCFEDVSKVNRIILYLYESAGKCWRAFYASLPRHGLQNRVWATVWQARAMTFGLGSPTAWATTDANAAYPVAFIAIQIEPVAGASTTVRFNRVVAQAWPKATIQFHCDDADTTIHSTFWPMLKEYGWKATLPINPLHIGTNGYEASPRPRMTVAQVDELYADGWDVSAHGWDHTTYGNANLSAADLLTDGAKCKKYLENHGWLRGSDLWCWPYGSGRTSGINDAASTIARLYRASRGYFGVTRAGVEIPCTAGTGTPHIYDPHAYGYFAQDEATPWTDSAFTDWLGLIVRQRNVGIWLVHQVADVSDYGNRVSVAHMRTALEAINAHVQAGRAEVATFSQYWSKVYAGYPKNRLEGAS